MMPQQDGFAFAEEIRRKNPDIPILFLTALDDIGSKRKGFHAGVDDYMVKPVDMDELVLRVEALLRRAKIRNENILQIGSLTLVRDEMAAYVNGQEVSILPRKFISYINCSHIRKRYSPAANCWMNSGE